MIRKTVRAAATGLLLALAAFTSTVARAEDKGLQAVLPAPIEAVQKAAADALTVVGCEIKKNEPGSLEGYRGRKIGVFVGSGGETITIALATSSDGTSVDIRTKKTFVGGAGQKNWDQPVLDEIKKTLAAGTPPAAPATPAQ